jgi:lipopolysaccharide export system protein LptA
MADESPPVLIEADQMISREQDDSVIFLGAVEASQGDITIRSDEMTVYYAGDGNEKEKGMASELKKLLCKGNVEISRGDWLGTGDHMVYYAKKRKIILSGNAKAWQGRNMVSGEKIIHYLDEQRTMVEQGENGTGRVKAIIHPESDKK